MPLPIPDMSVSGNSATGPSLTGENVRYESGENTAGSVTLNIYDASGNLVYSVEINLNQSTKVKETPAPSVRLYPNPAVDDIHLQLGESVYRDVRVEIYNTARAETDQPGVHRCLSNVGDKFIRIDP